MDWCSCSGKNKTRLSPGVRRGWDVTQCSSGLPSTFNTRAHMLIRPWRILAFCVFPTSQPCVTTQTSSNLCLAPNLKFLRYIEFHNYLKGYTSSQCFFLLKFNEILYFFCHLEYSSVGISNYYIAIKKTCILSKWKCCLLI